MGGDIRNMLQRLPAPQQGDGASGFDDLWRRGRRQRRMLQVVAMAGSVIALAATMTVIGAVVGWSPQLEVAEQPAGCPVTVPAGSFDPSPPYPDRPARGDEYVWYGTKDLWTMLPTDGHYQRRKSIWWSENFPGGQTEEQPPITVAWERLDLPGVAPIVSERGTNAHTETDGWFMIAGIDPDIPGCWRVTADYKGARLSYVYYLATSGDAEGQVTAAPSTSEDPNARPAALQACTNLIDSGGSLAAPDADPTVAEAYTVRPADLNTWWQRDGGGPLTAIDGTTLADDGPPVTICLVHADVIQAPGSPDQTEEYQWELTAILADGTPRPLTASPTRPTNLPPGTAGVP